MIKIDGMQIVIEGSEKDLIKDIEAFIALFTNNELIEKIAFGNGYEHVSQFFSIDNLLRYIFTICSAQKDEFKNLLISISKIIDECDNGTFKLLYEEVDFK